METSSKLRDTKAIFRGTLAVIGLVLPYLSALIFTGLSLQTMLNSGDMQWSRYTQVSRFMFYTSLLTSAVLWLPWFIARMKMSANQFFWIAFFAIAVIAQFVATWIFKIFVYFGFGGIE